MTPTTVVMGIAHVCFCLHMCVMMPRLCANRDRRRGPAGLKTRPPTTASNQLICIPAGQLRSRLPSLRHTTLFRTSHCANCSLASSLCETRAGSRWSVSFFPTLALVCLFNRVDRRSTYQGRAASSSCLLTRAIYSDILDVSPLSAFHILFPSVTKKYFPTCPQHLRMQEGPEPCIYPAALPGWSLQTPPLRPPHVPGRAPSRPRPYTGFPKGEISHRRLTTLKRKRVTFSRVSTRMTNTTRPRTKSQRPNHQLLSTSYLLKYAA